MWVQEKHNQWKLDLGFIKILILPWHIGNEVGYKYFFGSIHSKFHYPSVEHAKKAALMALRQSLKNATKTIDTIEPHPEQHCEYG